MLSNLSGQKVPLETKEHLQNLTLNKKCLTGALSQILRNKTLQQHLHKQQGSLQIT